MTKNLKNNSFFFLEILPRLRRVRMTLLLFPWHSKESHRKVDDEESENNPLFLIDSSFRFAPFRMTFTLYLSFWGIRQRRMTKNLKNNSFFFLEILPRLRRVRMTLLLFPCHSEETADRQDDEESENNPLFLIDSSFRFASFRMTFYFFPFVILRNSPKANDEESKKILSFS